jgi:hypothetical protein
MMFTIDIGFQWKRQIQHLYKVPIVQGYKF